MSSRRIATCAVLAALPLAACSFRTQTTGMAVEYNEFVAQTTNRQTVLNVLRAREREPMHFTSFAIVRGSVRGQGNAELGASLPRDTVQTVLKTIDKDVTTASGTTAENTTENTTTANDNAATLSPKLGITVSTGTDFDIAVNATDDFYRGILGPLKDSVVVHYLRQGFPADLLSHLVVGEFRFYVVFKKNGKDIDTLGREWAPGADKYGPVLVSVVKNVPDEADKAQAFQEVVDCRELAYVMDRRDKRAIPFGTIGDLSNVSPEAIGRVTSKDGAPGAYAFNIGESTDFKLALSEPRHCDEIRARLHKDARDRVNAFAADIGFEKGTPLSGDNVPSVAAGLAPRKSALPSRSIGSASARSTGSPSEGLEGSGIYEFETKGFFEPLLTARKLPAEYTGDLLVEITLRSVEGVIYYLGEYIRAPDLSPRLHGPGCQGEHTTPCIPILRVVRNGEVEGAAFADVVYRGVKYEVPLSGQTITQAAGRSSQTISLVQQLLNLHRTSKDLPITPLVRVAN